MTERHAAPLPQVSGTLDLDGLGQPVRIARDRWGVPHVYAKTEADLFFAQGFVQAQDRLFQMDLWRRSAQGRLSEVLGPNFAERDAVTRRIQYRGDPAADWASYGPDVRRIAEAFVSGVNAWITIARRDLPEEFVLAGWPPEFWKADDLLNRTDSFLQSGDAGLEALRARLAAAVGAVRANELVPADRPYALREIPPGLDAGAMGEVVAEALRRVGTAPFFLSLAAPVLPGASSGSNAWAIGRSRSATGAPLLASDPHRPLTNPSLRYLIHLQAPGWNVAGAVSPWLPGVVIGHNDRVAWGMAAFPADTQDIYVERMNPANPHQVESRGRFVDTVIVKDPVVIRGRAKPLEYEHEYTPNGVVIASDLERHLTFTLRWTGTEPGTAGELAALGLDRAASASQLLDALKRWKLPVVDVVYADADGAAGRHVAGLVPVRSVADGAVPAPGWRAPGWTGWRTFDGLPHASVETGPQPFVVAANQDVARTRRLQQLLAGDERMTVERFKTFQHDTTSWNAGELVPLLATVSDARPEVESARRRLLEWDRRVTADSPASALYVYWEEAILRKLAERQLTPDLLEAYLSRARLDSVMLRHPSPTWFGREPVKSRDTLLLDALASAVDRLKPAGDSTWGRLHATTFKHPLAIGDRARLIFDVGPIEQGGYAETVMATSSRASVDIGASFRAIFDLSDWDRAEVINAPGESGSPRTAHFSDLAKLWAAGEYFPLAFSDAAVQANTESTLILAPRRSGSQ